MCHACYFPIIIANKKPTEKVYNWMRHPHVGTCDVCMLVVASSKGDCPKKAKKNVAKNLPKSKMEDASHTSQIPNHRLNQICIGNNMDTMFTTTTNICHVTTHLH